jgi:hypothetical protein
MIVSAVRFTHGVEGLGWNMTNRFNRRSQA